MHLQQSMLSCINAGGLCYGLSITVSTCLQYVPEIEIEIEIESNSIEIVFLTAISYLLL